MPSSGWGWPSNAGKLSAPPLTTRPRRAMPGLIVYLHKQKPPRVTHVGFCLAQRRVVRPLYAVDTPGFPPARE